MPEQQETKAHDPQAYDELNEAKSLLRRIRAGALATLVPQSGFPFASLVNVATLPDSSPILLLSSLAGHTRHLVADSKLSLLLAEVGEGDPLAHPRLSLIGRGEKIVDAGMREVCKARFLNKHPKSAIYADFSDFAFWRVELEEAHLNGGFARAAKFSGAAVKTDISGADELIEGEAGALAHLNSEHQETLALYAKVLAHQVEGPWQAIGIDPEGLDLGLADLTARIVFPDRVETLASLRHTLVSLAQALK